MRPTIEDVQLAALWYFSYLEPGWLRSQARKRNIAWPRQIAHTVARRITGKSLPQIGIAFNRDHTTILNSIRAVSLREEDNGRDREAVEAITALAYRRAEHRRSLYFAADGGQIHAE